MNELQILEKEVTWMGEFNIYGTVEEPLFGAKDVAYWVGRTDVYDMIQPVDEDEKLFIDFTCSKGKRYNEPFLTETGVYEVLLLSHKPIAKEIKRELKKILHALRIKKAAFKPTTFADALEACAKEVRTREEAQKALFEKLSKKL